MGTTGLAEGQAHALAGQTEQAVATYQRLLREHGESPWAHKARFQEADALALARAASCSPEGPPFEAGLEFWWVGWGDDSAQRAISDFIKTELRSEDQA